MLLGAVCVPKLMDPAPQGKQVAIANGMSEVADAAALADAVGFPAAEAAELPVGTQLALTGRLQSREYIKMLGTTAERRTAYEISAISAEPVRE